MNELVVSILDSRAFYLASGLALGSCGYYFLSKSFKKMTKMDDETKEVLLKAFKHYSKEN